MLDCLYQVFNNLIRYNKKKNELYNIVNFFLNKVHDKKLYISIYDFKQILNYNHDIHEIYMDKNNIIHCKHFLEKSVQKDFIDQDKKEDEINYENNSEDESDEEIDSEEEIDKEIEDEDRYEEENESEYDLLHITIINGDIVLFNIFNEKINYENYFYKFFYNYIE